MYEKEGTDLRATRAEDIEGGLCMRLVVCASLLFVCGVEFDGMMMMMVMMAEYHLGQEER